MSKFGKFVAKTFANIFAMALRFPAVLVALAVSMVCVSLLINENIMDDDIVGRLIVTCVFTAFLGVAAVFFCERFKINKMIQLIINVFVLIAGVIYFFIFTSDEWPWTEFAYLAVFCFTLLALFLFIPTYRKAADFGKVLLVHVKSAFTALLYSVVIFAGLSIIYFSIDFLLLHMNEDIIAHIANIVFLFFMPVYYLALLPNFNATDDAAKQKNEEDAKYPKVLAVLVSYILIPLFAVFSGVLIAYIVKIVLTQVWPVGEIGPMVLGYSVSGYILYMLSLKLDNKFALAFRKLFPFFLIPMVVLQIVSCAIRINAYGVTEPRYYLVLIGVFSICGALYLIFAKVKNASKIVLLAALFAILSILPGIGAFGISKISQSHRLENILEQNNMLKGGALVPGNQVSESDKSDITSIVDYMSEMKYLNSLEWFPEELKDKDILTSIEFKDAFGFEPYYSGVPSEKFQYYYAMIDPLEQLEIDGYTTFFQIDLYNAEHSELPVFLADFTVGDISFQAYQKTGNRGEAIVEIRRMDFNSVLEISTLDILENIAAAYDGDNAGKGSLPAEQLTVKADGLGIRVCLILQQSYIRYSKIDGFTINHMTAYLFSGKSQ